MTLFRRLVARWLGKLVVLAILLLIGLPIIFLFVRPDRDFKYHTQESPATELTPDMFEAAVADDLHGSSVGIIDPRLSILRSGFGKQEVLLRLSGFPAEFAIHLPEGPLQAEIVQRFEEFMAQQPFEKRMIAGLRATRTLGEFIAEDDQLLAAEHRFTGRVFWVDDGTVDRYSYGDRVRGMIDDVNWLLADGESPSLEKLLGGNFSLFVFACGFACLVGVPAVLFFAFGAVATAGPAVAPEIRATGFGPGSNEAPTGPFVLTGDAPRVNYAILQQCVREYLDGSNGKYVMRFFGFSFALRLLIFVASFFIGIVMLPTIVWTINGIKCLWSCVKLDAFRMASNRELRDQLIGGVAVIVALKHEPGSNPSSEKAAIVLGSFDQTSDCGLADLAAIASRLRVIHAVGAQTEDDLAIEFLLHNDQHRREAPLLPEPHARGFDLVFVDALVKEELCCNFAGVSLVACIASTGKNIIAVQIPWSVIHSAVK